MNYLPKRKALMLYYAIYRLSNDRTDKYSARYLNLICHSLFHVLLWKVWSKSSWNMWHQNAKLLPPSFLRTYVVCYSTATWNRNRYCHTSDAVKLERLKSREQQEVATSFALEINKQQAIRRKYERKPKRLAIECNFIVKFNYSLYPLICNY